MGITVRQPVFAWVKLSSRQHGRIDRFERSKSRADQPLSSTVNEKVALVKLVKPDEVTQCRLTARQLVLRHIPWTDEHIGTHTERPKPFEIHPPSSQKNVR